MSTELRYADDPIQRQEVAVSIVMPAYNEEANIEQSVRKLMDALSGVVENYEIVVVDDGSTDGTLQKVRAMSALDTRIVGVRSPSNKGKGTAVKRASEYTRGNAIVILDSDMDVDPSDIRRYLTALESCDICVGSKRHPNSVYRAPLARKFLSVSFNKLVRLATGVTLSDSQTGFKAMNGASFKKIMNVISVKRYAYDVEVLAVAGLLHLRVAELPVNIEQKSMFGARHVVYMVVDLMGIVYRLRILRWYQKNLHIPSARYRPILRL